jgi:hypothetical protein
MWKQASCHFPGNTSELLDIMPYFGIRFCSCLEPFQHDLLVPLHTLLAG